MKGFGPKFAAVFIVATVVVILGALWLETSRGPSFRAADYADMNECFRNIPMEWAPGSLERDGAETACFYVHRDNHPATP